MLEARAVPALVGLPIKPARAARPDLAREQAPWTRALRAIRVESSIGIQL